MFNPLNLFSKLIKSGNQNELNRIQKIIKEINKNKKLFNLPNKKPILASNNEIFINPPSRSAKLRYVIRNNNNLTKNLFLLNSRL